MVSSRQMPERGMTLVEIMITLVISSIIAASTFMFFAGQQRIYEAQTKLLNIQQNLWAAMEVVARYSRGAGTGMFGCVKPASWADGEAQNGTRKRSTYPSPGPLTENLDTRPQTGLRAYDPDSSSSTGMQWVPPLWIINNVAGTSPKDAALHVLPGTDIITVAFGNRTSGTDYDVPIGLPGVTTTDSGTPIPLDIAGAGSMFRPLEFVLLLKIPDWGYGVDPPRDDRGCTLFQITPPLQAAALPHQNGGGGSIWNSPSGNVPALFPTDPITSLPETNAYAPGVSGVRNFGAFTWVTFFIQQMGTNSIPNLMMLQRHLGADAQPQVLAEGIEDLQVSFACDTGSPTTPQNLTNLDGQLNEGVDNVAHTNDAARKTDEWWNNVPGDTLPAMGNDGFCNLPTAVRITMVSRSLAPDDLIPPNSGNRPPDIEDHRPTGPSDSFRRRVLTTTVYPRNNKPQ